jgi:hypothetical protein
MPNNNAIRIIKANDKPNIRAFFCSFCGNLSETIEIKIILSIPNTTSSIIKVNKLIKPSAVNKISNIDFK